MCACALSLGASFFAWRSKIDRTAALSWLQPFRVFGHAKTYAHEYWMYAPILVVTHQIRTKMIIILSKRANLNKSERPNKPCNFKSQHLISPAQARHRFHIALVKHIGRPTISYEHVYTAQIMCTQFNYSITLPPTRKQTDKLSTRQDFFRGAHERVQHNQPANRHNVSQSGPEPYFDRK